MAEGVVTNDSGVFFISMQFKGESYPVPLCPEDDVAAIFSFTSEVLDFQPEHCKLICKGKKLLPEQAVRDAKLVEGSKVMLVATAANDIAYVQSQRADPLVKGFEEEERDERNRRKRAKAAQASAWGTKQDQQYRFRSIKPEFKYHTPTPFDAQKLLEKLATDPGIIDIMKTRCFEVGILTEMSPDEAKERMRKDGEPDKDLLGYNQNAGEMIVLKLRTDNVKGFRPYHDLINTLIHELTHNVWGPHDHNFWKLFGELKAQYIKFHSFWSHNGNSTSGASKRFTGFADDDAEETGSFGFVLGGASAGSVDPVLARQKFLDKAEASFSAFTCSCCGNQAPSATTASGLWCGACQPTSSVPQDNDVGCGSSAVIEVENDVGRGSSTVMEVEKISAEVEQVDSKMKIDVKAAVESGAATEVAVQAPSAVNGNASSSPTASGSEAASVAILKESNAAEPEAPDQKPAPADSRGNPAEVVATSAVVQDLELTDLEGCGLDGTVLWLQRFRTHLEKLWAMQPKGRGAVEIVLRLVRNIVDHPHDEKFRRVRADNPKIQAALLGGDFKEISETIMMLLGFERTTDDAGQSFFVLRETTFDCVKLQMGKELLESRLQPQLAQ